MKALDSERQKELRSPREIALLCAGSAVLTGILLLAVYAVCGFAPFGPTSLLTSDLKNQYIDFFAAYRQLFSGQSLFYSWQKGLGGNFIGLFAYYLASPFNLLLLPFSDLETGIFVLTLAKLCCAAASFTLYLCCGVQMRSRAACFFGAAYGLMSWSVMYSFCLLWMDVLVFLPLIILGLERLMQGKRPLLYVLSLAALLFANYYMAYMVALYCVLHFIWYGLFSGLFSSFGAFIRLTLQTAFYSVLGVGISAALWVPAFFALLQGKSADVSLSVSLNSTFEPLRAFFNLFVGRYLYIGTKGSAPFLYCTVLAAVLAIGYFFLHGESLLRKLVCLAVAAILLFSMWNQTLNTIWHMGGVPNGFPFRFVYLYVFFVLALAARTWENRNRLPKKFFYGVFAAAAVLTCLSLICKDQASLPTCVLTVTSCLLVAALLAVILRASPKASRVAAGVLLCAMSAEIAVNAVLLLKSAQTVEGYAEAGSYAARTANVKAVLDGTGVSCLPYSRFENTGRENPNEAYSVGYCGTTHFSSLYEAYASNTMESLGYEHSFYGTTMTDGNAAAETLLNVRYVLDASGMMRENKNAVGLFFTGSRDALALSGNLDAGEVLCTLGEKENWPDAAASLCGTVDYTFPSASRVSAQFTTGEGAILYTSIVYDTGWHIVLDGVPVTPSLFVNGLIAIDCAPGTHTLEMHYIPRGLTAGLAISLISLVMLVAAALFRRLLRQHA